MALDTLAGVRSEMSRLCRLALNGRIRSDEMTWFIYALGTWSYRRDKVTKAADAAPYEVCAEGIGYQIEDKFTRMRLNRSTRP
jgi:hypothetical protein